MHLEGNVGLLANGAGLTMTTMDVVSRFGGRPANFLEIGGEAYTKAETALDLVLANPGVKSLVVNFCGAFARTDVMAEGVVRAWEALKPSVPVFFSIHAAAKRQGTRVVGPNTAGLVTPGEAFVGIMPGHNANVFRPGRVGVISRSGSLGTLICLNLTRAGLGESAFIGIGGDPVIGTTTREALEALESDERTAAAVLVGEIGGAMEEEAADFAAAMRKPVVSFIAGAASPPGRRMGHAGAIVTGDRGSYASKRQALEAAGVTVVDTPGQIAEAVLATKAVAPAER